MRILKNIHPGEVLKEEFLEPMGISVYRLAKETDLSQTRLGQIIRGERSITAETALKLGKFFGVPAEFWMNLQTLYDIEEAQKRYKKTLNPYMPSVILTTRQHNIAPKAVWSAVDGRRTPLPKNLCLVQNKRQFEKNVFTVKM